MSTYDFYVGSSLMDSEWFFSLASISGKRLASKGSKKGNFALVCFRSDDYVEFVIESLRTRLKTLILVGTFPGFAELASVTSR